MIKIDIEKIGGIVDLHVKSVKNHINFEALQNREKAYIQKNLDFILSAKPAEHEKIINDAKINHIDNDRLKKAFVGGSKYGGNVGYAKFSSKNTTPYNAYDLSDKLKVDVCPYCNRNYTFTVKAKNGSTRPQFDHFYDKARYPILALSFYNLIPSCPTCNSSMKGRKQFSVKTHVHPYLEGFEKKAHFPLHVKNSSFYYDKKGFDIELKTNDEKAQNNIEDFGLNTLYENHKDIVLELIQKAEIYNESYIDELFNRYEGTLFKNREDLMRLITCGYVTDEDLHKRPLSKLIKDISKELDLL
jgi:hypothetical protein